MINPINSYPISIFVISSTFLGIYLWIATNYILNRFEHTHSDKAEEEQRKKTVGTIEIGGASLQIAYEVPENVC